MKAVVVDVNGKKAVVLSKDGRFVKVNYTKEMLVGGEITLPDQRLLSFYGPLMKALAAAAVFVFTIGTGYVVYSYNMPYSYINVDINPSLEIIANRFDRIIQVEAMNEEGAAMLENQQFKNQKVETVVEEIIKKASDKGYIKDGASNSVLLTVSSKEEKKTTDVEKLVQGAAEAKIESSGVKADVLVEKVTLKEHDEARKLDMSPGKLALIGKLQDVQPQATIEEYKDAPVKDILKAIYTQKKEDEKPEKEEKKDTKTEGKESPKVSPTPQSMTGVSAKKPSGDDRKYKNDERVKEEESKKDKEVSTKRNDREQSGKEDSRTPRNFFEKDKKDREDVKDRKDKEDEKDEKDRKDEKDKKDNWGSNNGRGNGRNK